MADVDNQTEVREFLTSRRARLTPDRAGIIGGGRRRVPGLRREEVAMLAGMSVDYYARMERGNLSGVSSEVLDALGRALRLDDAETAHLHALARAASPVGPGRQRPRATGTAVRPSLQRLLDTIAAPAYVSNPRKDFLAVNAIGHAVFSPVIDDPANQRNNARFTFLNPASQNFYTDWEAGADSIVASLRVEAGRNPHDRAPPTSSANSSLAAMSSAPGGRLMTSVSTAPEASASTTPKSAIWNSTTKPSNCPRTPD